MTLTLHRDRSIESDPESEIIGERGQHDVKSDDKVDEFDDNGFHIEGASSTDIEVCDFFRWKLGYRSPLEKIEIAADA